MSLSCMASAAVRMLRSWSTRIYELGPGESEVEGKLRVHGACLLASPAYRCVWLAYPKILCMRVLDESKLLYGV